MKIALEHAGADRGVLIVPRGDELRIEAEATSVRDTIEVTSATGAGRPGRTSGIDAPLRRANAGKRDAG